MALEVVGEVVGRLRQSGPDDEGEPGLLQRVQVPRREHPGIGHDDHVGNPVAFLERGQYRDQGRGLGLVPFEQVHLQREPSRVHKQPDLDLRVDPVLLTHPDSA